MLIEVILLLNVAIIGILLLHSVRLQEILDEHDISQRQLATMVNMRPGTINALCRETTDRIYTLRSRHL
ncbi:helix-turn-helix domain-containing protein [Cohnella sp. LGH]|uniref:helix-turn-helix domain-containing protein n=1 Tax=Cohnella sp. LGH TaxID=1619153 RepID=UPI0035301CB3